MLAVLDHDHVITVAGGVRVALAVAIALFGDHEVGGHLRFARDELAPKLTNGHHVTLPEFGHTETFWHSQDVARARLLGRFLDEGVVDATGYVHQPIVFEVERGWDNLAHRLLAVVVAGSLLLLLLCGVLVRIVRRRSRSPRVVGPRAEVVR